MKGLTYVILICIITQYASAQTNLTNLQKYWYYRDRFIHAFTYIGSGPGESLAGNSRGYKWDATGGIGRNELGFGADQTSQLGWYWAMLSTEYKLLKDHNLDYNFTKRELFYAMDALNRLDVKAESYYREGDFPPPGQFAPYDLNGFFMRHDIENRFGYDFWYEHEDELSNAPQFSTVTAAGSSSVMDGKEIPTWFVERFDNCEGSNEMTKDQVFHLIMGLAFIKKCMDPSDYYVENGITKTFMDGEANFVQEAKNIAERLMAICAGEAWCDNDYPDGGNNWCIGNPVTHHPAIGTEPCCCGLGTAAGTGAAKFGIAAAISYITDVPIEDYLTVPEMIEGNLVWQLGDALQWSDHLDWDQSNESQYFKLLLLAAVGHSLTAFVGGWNNTQQQLCTATSPEGPFGNGFWGGWMDSPIIPLIHAYLHDVNLECYTQSEYTELLNVAPCIGPYNFLGDPTGIVTNNFALAGTSAGEWSANNRFYHPEDRNKSDGKSEWSGMDYMLLYNLCQLYYGFSEGVVISSYIPMIYSDYIKYDNLMDYVEINDYPIINHYEAPVGGISWDENVGSSTYPKVVSAFSTITSDKVIGPGGNLTYKYGDPNGWIEIIPGFSATNADYFEQIYDPPACNISTNEYEKHASSSFNHNSSSLNDQTLMASYFDLSNSAQEMEVSQKTFLVYPNPASNNVTIQMEDNRNYLLEITDMYGKEVSSMTFNGPLYSVNISSFSSGFYYFRVHGEHGETVGYVRLVVQ